MGLCEAISSKLHTAVSLRWRCSLKVSLSYCSLALASFGAKVSHFCDLKRYICGCSADFLRSQRTISHSEATWAASMCDPVSWCSNVEPHLLAFTTTAKQRRSDRKCSCYNSIGCFLYLIAASILPWCVRRQEEQFQFRDSVIAGLPGHAGATRKTQTRWDFWREAGHIGHGVTRLRGAVSAERKIKDLQRSAINGLMMRWMERNGKKWWAAVKDSKMMEGFNFNQF